MTEAFNSVLVDARSKPVISMLEDIRIYMMKRWKSKRQKVEKWRRKSVLKLTAGYKKNPKKLNTGS